jgi:hypothetical protein
MFPKNFKLLYAFARKHCRCHQQRMICQNIFSHEGLEFDKWLEGLLTRRKKRQKALLEINYYERFVKRLVESLAAGGCCRLVWGG